MAYNRKNLLNEIEEVQAIYTKHFLEGVTAKYIYTHHIKGFYHISERTFFKYLSVNVAKERREIEEGRKIEENLPSLFDQDFVPNEDTNSNE